MIQLMPHQKEALRATEDRNRAAFYLDMGLGKTFVGSEKMMRLGTRVNLVVCQCSKVNDWIEHFKQYDIAMQVFNLTEHKSYEYFFTHIHTDNDHMLIGVINYELTFRRKELKNLSEFTLMLDESSLIQNENAKRSKFILGLKPKNVILLSGTPTGGKYEKLWSQCRLLGWNISKNLFYKQFIETGWVESDGFWRQEIIGYKNVDRLKSKLAQHGAVFMTTDQAGISLPQTNWIEIKTKPAKGYWEFWKNRYLKLNAWELIGDTSLTRRLYARQLCGCFNEHRFEAFQDLMSSTDDRLVVFYNFTEEFHRLRCIALEMDRPVSVLRGEEKDLTAYEQQSNSVTFIQYQAGAMGGNFQKANKIVYFSLPESAELWEQSQKRIHRIGQERPCFYYMMICPGTVEESILSALRMRKDYTDELFKQYEEGGKQHDSMQKRLPDQRV